MWWKGEWTRNEDTGSQFGVIMNKALFKLQKKKKRKKKAAHRADKRKIKLK